MTTYLLITSDKPTELTAFVGPKKPNAPNNKHGISENENPDYYQDLLLWEHEMLTAKASRLPVVNAESDSAILAVSTKGVLGRMVESGNPKGFVPYKLDTPVELEGWETEIVYQYRTNHWATVSKEIWDSWPAEDRKRQAYRLKRSEPERKKQYCINCGNEITESRYTAPMIQHNFCSTKCAIENAEKLKESPIEAKTQEQQESGELESLRKFKEYVHDRLDKAGVPVNPEPENNAQHGCRIEGRLNWIESRMTPESHKTQESQEVPFSRSIHRDLQAFIPKLLTKDLVESIKLGYVLLIDGQRVEVNLNISVS